MTDHPHYPDGFPEPADRSLLGRHRGAAGTVHVREHPHGYEVDVEGGPTFTVAGDRPDTVLRYLAGYALPVLRDRLT